MGDLLLYIHLAAAVLLFGLILADKVKEFRGLAIAASLLLLLTGAHNFMTRMVDAPKGWHALVGIKLLLALHVIAIVFLMARGAAPEKLARWRKSILVTGTLVMLIGLYYSNFAR
jgi:hypothetical protein